MFVCVCVYIYIYICHLVPKSCLTLATLWSAAYQAPLSMGFPKQEHWSGLPFPSPGDLPDPVIKPVSPALAGRFFITEPPENPLCVYIHIHIYIIYVYFELAI